MIKHLINEDKLSIELIKEIHSDLTDRLRHDEGFFKKNENMIIGAEFQTPSPAETLMLISQLIDNLNYRLERAETKGDNLKSILDTPIQFERIHPLSDGNGRNGRMIMSYSLLKEGFPPLIIEKETKGQYVELLATQDVDSFLFFAKSILNKENKRMVAFQNMDQEKIKENEE